MTNNKIQLSGVVYGNDGTPLAGLRVEAWDDDLFFDDLLGSAVTDEDGKFTIAFNEKYYKELMDRKPDVYFRVFYKEECILSTEDDICWNIAKSEDDIKLVVPLDGSGIASGRYGVTIKGTVSMETGFLTPGITVAVVNQLVLKQEILAKASPDPNGGWSVQVVIPDREPPAIMAMALNADNRPLSFSQTIYEITTPIRLDILIPADAEQELPEFEVIGHSIKPLIRDTKVVLLNDHQITLIAEKIKIPYDSLISYREAFRLGTAYKLDVEVLYGVFRSGLEATLAALLGNSTDDLTARIQAAVKDNTIEKPTSKILRKTMDTLAQLALRNALNEPLGTGGATFGNLVGMADIPQKAMTTFVQLYSENTRPILEFWAELEAGSSHLKPAQVSELRFTVQAGSLALGHIPMMQSIQNLRSSQYITDISELVSWDRDKLSTFLARELESNPEILPPQVPGDDNATKIENYALGLERIMEQAYPTAFIVDRMRKDENTTFTDMLIFAENNPEFAVGTTNIGSYLKENPDALAGIQDPNKFHVDLAGFQNRYMLSPGFDRYESMKVLETMHINSSLDIARLGRQKFTAQYIKAGGTEQMAEMVYEMADHNTSLMQSTTMNIATALSVNPMVTTIPNWLNWFKGWFNPDLDPNLETLFGSMDFCACEHCRSIYSPAAYLVDVLQFLKKGDTNTGTYSTALEVLFDRRPDLCYIDLNCENTNTPQPYIDLINEIYENAIYEQTTGTTPDYEAYQTTGTAEELLAHPEHIREEVYNTTLKTSVYPWLLPFDLWTEEGRVYLEHLKLPRHKIMDAWLTSDGNAYLTDQSAVNEILRLSQTDREIILGATSETNQALWGLSGSANLVNTLSNPDKLLENSGLNFDDLKNLLKTWFVNPDAEIEIDYDDEAQCILDKATLSNLTENALMNLVRFIRLRDKLHWSTRDLDMALKMLDAATISATTLLQLTHLFRLKDYLKLPLHSLLALWGKIFTGHPKDEETERSPYEQLFQNKAVLNPVDEAFELAASLQELDVTTHSIWDHASTIKAGIGVSSADLETLVNAVLPDEFITLSHLSVLYRHALLAKGLKLTVEELLLLIDITGIDPFDAANSADTIILCRNYLKIRKTKLKIRELEYLFYEKYDVAYGVGFSEDTLSDALTDLHLALKKIEDDNQFSDDPQGETTTAKLATLLTEENLNTAIEILEQTSDLSTFDQETFVTETLGFFLSDPAEAVDNLVDPNNMEDKQARYEYILTDLLAFLSTTGKREMLKQKIANNLGIGTDIAEALLFTHILSPDNPADTTGETLLADIFVTTEEETIARDLFPEQFNAYVLLHKTALILDTFKVGIDELNFLFKDAFDPDPVDWPGWFNFNDLPVIAAGSPDNLFGQILRLTDLFGFYHKLPANDENILALMLDAFDPASATTEADFLEAIAGMTKWELEDLTELATHFGYSKLNYANEVAFVRLTVCMDILKISGSAAADTASWMSTELSSTVSGQIVHSVKSLYSEKEWLDIARPLRNKLREPQQTALTKWLLFNQSGIDSEFELYGYYLVDPEMSACMLTSRIRLAMSSAQLFVQRALMNLEPEIDISDSDLEHWTQWVWMKTYRLWEANRKVFCYPENWLEPAWRDNKSSFFEELEAELSQAEIDQNSVESAYLNYLQKVEWVSNMDVMAICRAEESSNYSSDAYYLFARTVGEPNELYFRKWEVEGTWTSWAKIETDFEGDHLIPIVYNNKLYLFWPVFTTKTSEAEVPADEDDGEEPPRYREIQMAWCFYSNGQWSASRVTKESLSEWDNNRYNSSSAAQFDDGVNRFFISKEITSANKLKLTAYERYYESEPLSEYEEIGAFIFNPSMKVELGGTLNSDLELDAVGNSRVYFQEFREYKKHSYTLSNPLTFFGSTLFSKTPSDEFSLTFVEENGLEAITCYPMVYQDTKRTFFIYFSHSTLQYIILNHYHLYISDFMNVVNADGVDGLLDPDYTSYSSLANDLRRQQIEEEFFTGEYGSVQSIVDSNQIPIDEIDFSHLGAYSTYNWELFYHIPMLVAEKLTLNQKFEEAQQWIHYIFDPTETSTEFSTPQRFWKIKPFVEIYDEAADGTPASIQELMVMLNEGNDEMEAQVEAWRDDPFNPHLIARMRISAYQKSTVMRYIDNLLQWADMLFRQDTMETTNEAMQLYMLAWYILGEEPVMVDGKEVEDKSYCELEEEGIDDFSNAMVVLESRLVGYFGAKYLTGFNKFKAYLADPSSNYEDMTLYARTPVWFTDTTLKLIRAARDYKGISTRQKRNAAGNFDLPNLGYGDATVSIDGQKSQYVVAGGDSIIKYAQSDISSIAQKRPSVTDKGITRWKAGPGYEKEVIKTLYFCIPQNENLLEYWDLVEDRLFKLRNCMNIEGIVRQLSLFDPPLDPGALIGALAAGMSLSSVLNDLNASLPNYRFAYMVQKAKEFAEVVKNVGNLYLSVLEKRDAEDLALLRASGEVTLLEALTTLKELQLDEADTQIDVLKEKLKLADERFDFYDERERWSVAEGFQVGLMGTGIALQLAAMIVKLAGASTYALPSFTVGVAGWAGSPVTTMTTGGEHVGNTLSTVSDALGEVASIVYQGANLSGIIAAIQRRNEDWDHLADQAELEVVLIGKEIEAADLRKQIADQNLRQHKKQIEQREAEYQLLESKFTNKDLYDWMIGQASSVYFQAYQMAYDLAKRAERSYKFELASAKDSFVSYGYWDSLKKGLLAGEKLHNDLLRMEASYLEKNKRTYEITKHVSLSMVNPFALLQLKENGTCYFDLPEEIFDLDHPGQYLRRIKSINVTIPCVAGPYTGVNGRLILFSNSIRSSTEVESTDASTYPKRTDGSEDRFIENLGMIQSIATSSARDDNGLFVLDFNDERYLPFEGAGVISSWALELPGTFRSFDYNSITDLIVTVNYTARDGGEILRSTTEDYLLSFARNSATAPLERLISLRHEFSQEWYQFMHPGTDELDQQTDLALTIEHFPYVHQGETIEVQSMDVILQLRDPSLYSNGSPISLYLTIPVSGEAAASLTANSSESSDNYLNGQPVTLNLASSSFDIDTDGVTLTLRADETNLATVPAELVVSENGHTRLNTEEIENIFLIVHYNLPTSV